MKCCYFFLYLFGEEEKNEMKIRVNKMHCYRKIHLPQFAEKRKDEEN